MLGSSTERLPMTWKNGTASSVTRWPAGADGASPRRIALRALEKGVAKILVVSARWVPSAPLGAPVVPEV